MLIISITTLILITKQIQIEHKQISIQTVIKSNLNNNYYSCYKQIFTKINNFNLTLTIPLTSSSIYINKYLNYQ